MTGANANAVKPFSPITAECATVSSSGDTFKVKCTVTAVSGPQPDLVTSPGITDSAVTVKEIVPPSGIGTGDWLFTLEFLQKRETGVPFEARYSNGPKIRFGAIYDPYGAVRQRTGAAQGKTVIRKDGTTVREYMSK